MEPQQAESEKSLRKLHKLLEACVATSPEAKIKYKHLKGALQTLQQRFGQELLSAHFDMPDKTLLPGKVADCMGVLLKHWRRCTSSEANWSKLTKQLEDSEVVVVMRVYKQTSGKQGTGRVLGPKVSDVTVDSEGFPALLTSALHKGSSSDQEQGSEASSLSMDSSGFPKLDELDARATAQSPPPPLKKDWRKGAGLLKRPAAKTAVEPPKKKPAGAWHTHQCGVLEHRWWQKPILHPAQCRPSCSKQEGFGCCNHHIPSSKNQQNPQRPHSAASASLQERWGNQG